MFKASNFKQLLRIEAAFIPRSVKICESQQTRKISIMQQGNKESQNGFAEKDKFLSDTFELVMKQVVQACRDRNNPVVRFKTPEELQSLIDFQLAPAGVEHSELLNLCSKAIDYSILTGHPRFCNQQYGGLDAYGLAGEIVTSSLNTNGHTFEASPVFSVAETVLINHILKFVGNDGEGIFCPGGTYSNMLAMNMARLKRFPETKTEGIYGLPKLISFCSEQAHYSAQKNSALLGFGESNSRAVKCDEKGKMIPADLERKILTAKDEGSVPFFVTATAATTVLGAFDPFHEIADLCKKHGLWMHVDGAWGASALLSKKWKHLCSGVERADSMAWNFHKMVSAPLQCSALLLREKGFMKKCHSLAVPYLFQEGKPYDQSFDLGRNLVCCSRRVDAFKLWLMWKAKGDAGMENHVDKAMDNANYLMEALKKREHFRLVIPQVEYTNVSFWYTPPSLRGQKEDDEFFQKLAKVVPTIKLRMQKKGSLMIGFSPVPGVPTFFRMVIMNELVTHQDIDFVLDEIERNGKDL